ncbi:MAG: putative DNA-binding domain-containing protein [Myxococcota bacterium]
MSLPDDWRAQIVRMVTDPAPIAAQMAGAWIAPGPIRTAEDQLRTYREQYRLRTTTTLRDAYPALAATLGPGFDDLAWRYLCDHPSTTWTLDRLGDAFPEWLESASPDKNWAEIAHLDWAVHHAATCADATPLPLAGLTGQTPLMLAPGVSILRMSRPWHTYRQQIIEGASPQMPGPAPTAVAIYRVGGQVRDRVLAPLEATFLAGFITARPLDDAVERLIQSVPDASAVTGPIGTWLQDAAARSLFQRVAGATSVQCG